MLTTKYTRTLTDVPIEEGPDILNNKLSPLILVKPSEIICARTKGEREEVLRAFCPETDTLLIAWMGQWSTSVFVISNEDLVKRGLNRAKRSA